MSDERTMLPVEINPQTGCARCNELFLVIGARAALVASEVAKAPPIGGSIDDVQRWAKSVGGFRHRLHFAADALADHYRREHVEPRPTACDPPDPALP